jgi:hypothetical protein
MKEDFPPQRGGLLLVGLSAGRHQKWEVLLMFSVFRSAAYIRPVVAALLLVASAPAFGQQAPAASPEAPAAPAAAPGAAAPAAGGLTLELNKLAQVDNACHAYVIVNNQTAEPVGELTVDVYMFDKAGVILRGLALQFTELRPARATVVPFELPDLPCGEISRVLLNKVLTCTKADGSPVAGCGDRLSVSTKSAATFDY